MLFDEYAHIIASIITFILLISGVVCVIKNCFKQLKLQWIIKQLGE